MIDHDAEDRSPFDWREEWYSDSEYDTQSNQQDFNSIESELKIDWDGFESDA